MLHDLLCKVMVCGVPRVYLQGGVVRSFLQAWYSYRPAVAASVVVGGGRDGGSVGRKGLLW